MNFQKNIPIRLDDIRYRFSILHFDSESNKTEHSACGLPAYIGRPPRRACISLVTAVRHRNDCLPHCRSIFEVGSGQVRCICHVNKCNSVSTVKILILCKCICQVMGYVAFSRLLWSCEEQLGQLRLDVWLVEIGQSSVSPNLAKLFGGRIRLGNVVLFGQTSVLLGVVFFCHVQRRT